MIISVPISIFSIMKYYLVTFLVGLFIGAVAVWFIRQPKTVEPITEYISYSTYERMFPTPARFSAPDYRFIVHETVETRIDTVRVPVNRSEPFRLFYGDLNITPQNVRIGFWNPNTLQFEVDHFDIPRSNWGFEPSVSFVYGSTFIARSNVMVRYRSVRFGAELGYLHDFGGYWGGVLSVRF